MLKYVPFNELNDEHLKMIAESMLAPPKAQWLDAPEVMSDLMKGNIQCYAFRNGLVLVEKRQDRLILAGLCCHDLIKQAALIAEALKRLAADWQCDTIETTTFDPRLTSVIQRLGGHVESWTLTLAVE